MELLRSQVLDVINSTSKFSEFAQSADQLYEIRAGLFPKEWVIEHLRHEYPVSEIRARIADLLRANKIIETESYYILNPKNRTRPIATQYDIPKPNIRANRTMRSYIMLRKDRLLLWYAAANDDLSGSKGERYAIWDILRFFRSKPVQRLWRKYKQKPRWRIPKDAL